MYNIHVTAVCTLGNMFNYIVKRSRDCVMFTCRLLAIVLATRVLIIYFTFRIYISLVNYITRTIPSKIADHVYALRSVGNALKVNYFVNINIMPMSHVLTKLLAKRVIYTLQITFLNAFLWSLVGTTINGAQTVTLLLEGYKYKGIIYTFFTGYDQSIVLLFAKYALFVTNIYIFSDGIHILGRTRRTKNLDFLGYATDGLSWALNPAISSDLLIQHCNYAVKAVLHGFKLHFSLGIVSYNMIDAIKVYILDKCCDSLRYIQFIYYKGTHFQVVPVQLVITKIMLWLLTI